MTKPACHMRAVGVVNTSGGTQVLAEETPVALVYNGSTQAVMMATPSDLEDFATGFALTEGLATPADITDVEVTDHAKGIEAAMWLSETRAQLLDARRRASVGPTGCGLCGIESLDEAVRTLPQATATTSLPRAAIHNALDTLRHSQPLHDETHAVHAAGFYHPTQGLIAAREDVGRHNALDKLIGHLHRAQIDATEGAILLTSRISVDMVQKAAMARCPIIIAVSATTAQAVRTADTAQITLISGNKGNPRLYTHTERITP